MLVSRGSAGVAQDGAQQGRAALGGLALGRAQQSFHAENELAAQQGFGFLVRGEDLLQVQKRRLAAPATRFPGGPQPGAHRPTSTVSQPSSEPTLPASRIQPAPARICFCRRVTADGWTPRGGER